MVDLCLPPRFPQIMLTACSQLDVCRCAEPVALSWRVDLEGHGHATLAHFTRVEELVLGESLR